MLQEVLLHCDSDEDYDDDYLDDPNEPVMDGSDDEFSDLEGNNWMSLLTPVQIHLPNAGSCESSSASASPDSPGSTTWTATRTHIPIQPFTSPTGLVEDISEHPIEEFSTYFSHQT